MDRWENFLRDFFEENNLEYYYRFFEPTKCSLFYEARLNNYVTVFPLNIYFFSTLLSSYGVKVSLYYVTFNDYRLIPIP